MMRNLSLVLVVGQMLAGCTLEAGPAADVPPENACGADRLQNLMGQDVGVFERMGRQGPSRILRQGEAMTMGYSAGRVNVELDGNETISRVFCG